ncbi:MAG TPA: hypothetical protein PLL88_07510 [Anaerolineaceae bacterium]|nr:hypothetical protein [Anaerolineaceae bacterium]
MPKKSRTIRSFQFKEALLPIVKKWAEDQRFTVEVDGNTITCEKGIGLMTSPITVTLEKTKETVQFEAYLKVDAITMFSSLLMAPEEMHLESGDGELTMERKYGRDKVNKLLEMLGQPLIE